eukprot:CAMPEP_0178532670 /NCGR_PEP_ID=MMETSP0696-20121128/34090_1 /TAXON_ID=265572 /ORGANISM="Extubocellulus spinifer, Strain CCMP396" /LENGTH=713 /DNA_ID=CAMNT_0020164667 /DNA_START=312 /DNA_END=2453 /DNA_ORIENTATION=+
MLHKLLRLNHDVSRDVIDRHLAMNHVPEKWKRKFTEYHSWDRYTRYHRDPYDEYNEWVDQENAKLAPAPDAAAASAASNQNIVPVSSEALVVLPSPQRESKTPKKRTFTSALSPEAEQRSKRIKVEMDNLLDLDGDEDMFEDKLANDLVGLKAEAEDVCNQVKERHEEMVESRRKMEELDEKFSKARQLKDERADDFDRELVRQVAEEKQKVDAVKEERAQLVAELAAVEKKLQAAEEEADANTERYRLDAESRKEEDNEYIAEKAGLVAKQKSKYNKAVVKAQARNIKVCRLELPKVIRAIERYLEDPDLDKYPCFRQEAEEHLRLLRAFAGVGAADMVHPYDTSSQNIVPVSSEALVVLPSPQRKKPKKRTFTTAMSPEAERETKRRKKSSDVLRASFNTDCDMAESNLLPTFNKAMGMSKNIRNQVGEEDRAVKAIVRRLVEHDDKLAEGRQMVDDQKDLHRMERLRQEAGEEERIKAAEREEEDALARYEAAKENTKAVTAQAAANNEVYRRDNEIRDADVEEVWEEIKSDADRQASHYNKELIKAQGKRSNTIRVDLPARIRDLQRLLEMPGFRRCHPQRHQQAEDELKLLLALLPMADVGLENKVHFRDVHPKLIQEYIDVKSRADVMRLRVIETSPESATSDIVGIFKVLNDKRYFENEHYLRLFTEDEGIKKDYPNGPLTKFPTCNSSYSADKWKQMLIDFLLIE